MKRILVADDNANSRELIREVLELEGFEVEEAGDGAEALARIRANSYDLVLLDIQMPVLDGYSVVRALREDAECRPPRIIAVTAYAMHGDREKALDAGFSGYITKPLQIATLRGLMQEMVGGAG